MAVTVSTSQFFLFPRFSGFLCVCACNYQLAQQATVLKSCNIPVAPISEHLHRHIICVVNNSTYSAHKCTKWGAFRIHQQGISVHKWGTRRMLNATSGSTARTYSMRCTGRSDTLAGEHTHINVRAVRCRRGRALERHRALKRVT